MSNFIRIIDEIMKEEEEQIEAVLIVAEAAYQLHKRQRANSLSRHGGSKMNHRVTNRNREGHVRLSRDYHDPALIRRERMDKHTKSSYCSFEAFKVLAKNYLDIESHELFPRVEQLLAETNTSPADVAENLMPKSADDDCESCLNCLISVLENVKEVAMSKANEEEKLRVEKKDKIKEKMEESSSSN